MNENISEQEIEFFKSRDRNMTIYHLDTIDGNDIDSIVEKFSKAYSDLKEIVDNA